MITVDKLYDKDFRDLLRRDVEQAIKSVGIEEQITQDYDYLVKTNTKEATYVVIPDSSYSIFDTANLQQTQAGIKAAGVNIPHTVGSVGSFGSASSAGCACTTISTIGSAGSVGSAGTGT